MIGDAYIPPMSEVPVESVSSARDTISTDIKAQWPDVETSPKTTVGDLVVTPLAYQKSAYALGLGYLLSDLNLANVANGVVKDCEFVQGFINDFGVNGESYSTKDSGIMRMFFTKNARVELDRSLKFGTTTSTENNEFRLYLPYEGNLYIFEAGSNPPPAINAVVLQDLGSGLYSCDVRVEGTMVSEITSGTSMSISRDVPNLSSLVAAADFVYAVDTTATLAKLAMKARESIAAPIPVTKTGFTKWARSYFGDIASIAVQIQNDQGFLRWNAVPDYSAKPYVQFLIQADVLVETSQVVRCTQTISGTDRQFVGVWKPVSSLNRIVSINSNSGGTGGIDLLTLGNTKVASISPAFLGNAYESDVSYRLTIPDSLPESDYLNILYDSETSTYYADVLVTYISDPLVDALAKLMSAPQTAPIGYECQSREPINVTIDTLKIAYKPVAGIDTTLDAAADRIAEYINTLAYPDRYSIAVIAKIMQECGAQYTYSVKASGTARVHNTGYVYDGTSTYEVEPYVFTDIDDLSLNTTLTYGAPFNQNITLNADNIQLSITTDDIKFLEQ